MLEQPSHLLEVAQRASVISGAPVVGGIAVFLHGYPRTTDDIDLFSHDPAVTDAALRTGGATWDARRRQHVLDGVPVHIVTVEQTGSPPTRLSRIRGVRVVCLADLIRFKLWSGLGDLSRAKDLADVVELIRRIPLDKRFAARLPRAQRAPFKRLVEAIRRAGGR